MADNLDTIYSPANKPPGVEAPAWAQTIATTKPAMKPYLLQTQLSVIKQRNDNVRAIRDLTALLRKDPTQATVSYALAQASLAVAVANKKPEDQPVALYHFARAAAYDGPGSMPAEARKQVLAYLKDKAYSTYHGSAEGLDDLLALAKTNPFPPADFKILSTVDIALAKQKAEAEAAAKDPMMTLWVKGLKDFILKDDTFFDANVKGAALPGGTNGVTKFKGKIVSISPNPRAQGNSAGDREARRGGREARAGNRSAWKNGGRRGTPVRRDGQGIPEGSLHGHFRRQQRADRRLDGKEHARSGQE